MLLGGRCGGGSPGSFSFGPGSAAPMGAFWSSTGYNAGNGYLYAMSPLFWPAYMPGQAYLTGSGAVGGLVAGSKAVGGFGYSVRCVKD